MSFARLSRRLLSVLALTMLCLSLPYTGSAHAQDEGYGYYEVADAASLNIRARPYMSSEVLTVVQRGDILIKWKPFCSLRPWCPVQIDDIRGWAGKDYLLEVEP